MATRARAHHTQQVLLVSIFGTNIQHPLDQDKEWDNKVAQAILGTFHSRGINASELMDQQP